MAFTPILSDRRLSYAYNSGYYRNANRENLWGSPVYFCPHDANLSTNGFGGPHYRYNYNYNNSPETARGNCTWWCAGRLRETEGKNILSLINGSWNANLWYEKFTGTRYITATNAVAGDIIVFKGGDGHVMFIEKVENGTIYISHSAWSTLGYWDGYACRVNSYSVSEIYAGNSINIYKGSSYTNYMEIVGIIHTGSGGSPGPTPTDEELKIYVTPSHYDSIMRSNADYIDFPFTVTISGIPEGETVSGGNTYPGLVRVANTGWSYTDYYTSSGTYRRATKSQTLRYYREHNYAYNYNTYMRYNISKSTGTIDKSYPIWIVIEAKSISPKLIAGIMKRKKRKPFTIILKK